MSVKLYRHNKSGDVVAAIYKENDMGDKEYIRFDGSQILFDSGLVPKKFEEVYTALPEAPEVGSTAWAWHMLEQGFKVRRKSFVDPEAYCCLVGCKIEDQNGHSSGILYANDWEIYEEPKPLVEKLPHEFIKDEKVLVRSLEGWSLGYFKEFNMTYNKYAINTKSSFGVCYESRCLPYEGNEHLEGTFIGEHEYGAVPKGYVPPHVPKLGDDDYWMMGDKVIDLSINEAYVIAGVDGNTYVLSSGRDALGVHIDSMDGVGFVRKIYHKGSYVREDGTVHEHIPTRSHYITQK